MKKQIGKITGGLLAVVLLVTGLVVGASGASSDTEYSPEDMLVFAIEDEYLAQAEYDAIMNTYGVQKPFSNIVKAEANHIRLLESLFEKYNVSIPEKDWASLVTVPETIDAAYAIGVETEKENIAMYESFLKEDLPDDVRKVFEALKNASEKHLIAFQRKVDGVACNGNGFGLGNGAQKGKGNGNRGNGQRNGNGGNRGNGQRNGNCSQDSCIHG